VEASVISDSDRSRRMYTAKKWARVEGWRTRIVMEEQWRTTEEFPVRKCNPQHTGRSLATKVSRTHHHTLHTCPIPGSSILLGMEDEKNGKLKVSRLSEGTSGRLVLQIVHLELDIIVDSDGDTGWVQLAEI
jgi:hypothetical protein